MIVSGSNTMTSAYMPSRSRPRSRRPKPVGDRGTRLADGILQGQPAAFPHIPAHDPGVGSVGARMNEPTLAVDVRIDSPGVGAKPDPRLGELLPQVVLAHHHVHAEDVVTVALQQFDRGFLPREAEFGRHIGQRASFELLVLRLGELRQQDRLRAVGMRPAIPSRRSGASFRPGFWPASPDSGCAPGSCRLHPPKAAGRPQGRCPRRRKGTCRR